MDREIERHLYNEVIAVLEQDIYKIAVNAVDNHYIAQEITQNVLMKAWNSFHQLRDYNKAYSWVMKITENTIRDFLRHKRIHISLEEDSLVVDCYNEDMIASFERDLESIIIQKENMDRFFEALRLLDPKYSTIIRLYLFGNQSHKDIAKSVGRKESLVRVQYSRGMDKLRIIYYDLENGGKLYGQKR